MLDQSVILAGVARSGKTTVAERLHRTLGLSLIPVDLLISSFEDNFPELGILSGQHLHNETSHNVFNFLHRYIHLHEEWQNYQFIMDTTHLLPQQVAEHGLDKKYRVAFLGYPNISVDEKLSQIRLHRTLQADWTQDETDDQLRPIIRQMIALGQTLQTDCARYNLTFFDTSQDFDRHA